MTHIFPGFLIPVLTTFLSKATDYFSAEERGENTPERKVTSTGDRTHNHQVQVRHTHHWATRVGVGGLRLVWERVITWNGFWKQSRKRRNPNNTMIIVQQHSCELTHYHTMLYFDALKIYTCEKHCEMKQEGQDGPGSLTWFFEIALAIFFVVIFREEFTRISLCLYSARSLHSLIPCLLTDQNFKNNSEKGHSRNISMRLFKNLTNNFRRFFRKLFMFI